MRLISDSVSLSIEGDPVGWARPRFCKGRAFTADKQRDAKHDLQWFFTSQWKREPIERGIPIELEVTFNFKAPKPKQVGAFKTTKPDIDNLLKLILDAGNGILYWDDAQVVRQISSKRYGAVAGTVISLRVLEESEDVPR